MGGAALSAQAVYRKIALRLIPFLFLCYVLNYLDRVNISFASLQFREELGIDAGAYGFSVSVFFIGYVLFEVPSNLILQRFGARRTIMRIMVLWGLVSISTLFVRSATQLYIVRILLGIAEAGFFPGVIFYLSGWFPSALRARVLSQFVLAIAVSGIVGGPLSGGIMTFASGLGGLHGWQWLYLIEGIPPVLAGIAAYFYLDDSPAEARWLTQAEKHLVTEAIAVEASARDGAGHRSFGAMLRDPRLYAAAAAYMTVAWAGSVINFWGPTVIREAGVKDAWSIGLLSAVPYAVGAVGMLLINRHSDLKLERRWHYAGSAMLAGAAIALLPLTSGHWQLIVVFLALLSIGYLTSVAVFWSIPTAYFSSATAAGGIALISSLGQCGSFIAPNLIGWAQQTMGSTAAGFWVIAAGLFAGSAAIVLAIPAKLLQERRLSLRRLEA